MYDITANTVEYVRLVATALPESLVDGKFHAFKLSLPADYVANSSNPKKDTLSFKDSEELHSSIGKLQLVPPSFSDLYEAKVYYGGNNEFFDYKAKYEGESQEITPAEINQNLSKKIKKTSIDIYKKMNLKGICRIDFILKNKTPYVIEINTIPGMSQESIIPQQIKAAGIKMTEVITMSLSNANI